MRILSILNMTANGNNNNPGLMKKEKKNARKKEC